MSNIHLNLFVVVRVLICRSITLTKLSPFHPPASTSAAAFPKCPSRVLYSEEWRFYFPFLFSLTRVVVEHETFAELRKWNAVHKAPLLSSSHPWINASYLVQMRIIYLEMTNEECWSPSDRNSSSLANALKFHLSEFCFKNFLHVRCESPLWIWQVTAF